MSEIIKDSELRDESRGRVIPVRTYEPHQAIPVRANILFSVGFGGNRDGYAFLARAWADLGYRTHVVEHTGSNLAVLKELPQKDKEARNREVVRLVRESDEVRHRPLDLLFAQAHLLQDDSMPLLLGGHSYGSYSVLAVSGMRPLREAKPFPKIQSEGLLLISPQPPGMMFAAGEYAQVDSPTLVLTGTQDDLLDGEASFSERARVHACLNEQLGHLTVLHGTKHMTFAGIGLGIGEELRAIRAQTKTWWSFVLGEVSQAHSQEGLSKYRGPRC